MDTLSNEKKNNFIKVIVYVKKTDKSALDLKTIFFFGSPIETSEQTLKSPEVQIFHRLHTQWAKNSFLIPITHYTVQVHSISSHCISAKIINLFLFAIYGTCLTI